MTTAAGHVCPVHSSLVIFSEHGTGMCLRCCWDLRRFMDDEEAQSRRAIEARLAAIRGCGHTQPVLGCYGGCWRFGS